MQMQDSQRTVTHSKELPEWMKDRLDAAGAARIAAAVASAEARTSGEIVPMIVRSSVSVGHVPAMLFAIFFATLMMLAPVLALFSDFAGLETPLWLMDLGCLVTAAVLAALGSRAPFFIRLCVPRLDRATAVARRAQLEFRLSRVGETKGQTGVLIFVSLFERQAIVLGDGAIASRLSESDWKDVVALLLNGVRTGDFASGFVSAIDRAGEHLAQHFPIATDDRNELSNELIVKD